VCFSLFVYLIRVLLCVGVYCMCACGMSAHWLKMIRSPVGYRGFPNHSVCLFHTPCQIYYEPSAVLWIHIKKIIPVVNLPIKLKISLRSFWKERELSKVIWMGIENQLELESEFNASELINNFYQCRHIFLTAARRKMMSKLCVYATGNLQQEGPKHGFILWRNITTVLLVMSVK